MNMNQLGGYLKSGILLVVLMLGLANPLGASLEITSVVNPLESGYAPVGRIPGTGRPPFCSLELLQGEAGLRAVSLYNASSESFYGRVYMSGLEGLRCILREAVHIRSRQGHLPADVLPELYHDSPVVVPPGENRQIFLEFPTRGAAPGIYRGALRIYGVDKDQKSFEVPVHVRIFPCELPEKHPLQVMTWDCSLRKSSGKQQEVLLQELRDHYVNNFHVINPVPWEANRHGKIISGPDFSQFGETAMFLKGRGRLMLRCVNPNDKAPDILTEPGRRAYGTFIRRLLEYLHMLGFSYQDFVFYPLDENTGPVYAAAASIIRQIDPKVVIYANPDRSLAQVSQVADSRRLVDYMQFNHRLLKQPGAWEKISEYRRNLSVLSIYWCPVVHKSLPPSWYREMGHLAWQLKLDGTGYWSSLWMNQKGDYWAAGWDDFYKRNASPVTVYPGRNCLNIPSRRWKAFRAGLEDWLVFDLVRRRGNRELSEKIDRALKVRSESPEQLQEVRRQAVRFLGGR